MFCHPPPFEKHEDEYTRAGWTRVDQGLPGWAQLVRVVGFSELAPDELVEDTARFINDFNRYMFDTRTYVGPRFHVRYWKR